jgi:uncharacterized membrane protein
VISQQQDEREGLAGCMGFGFGFMLAMLIFFIVSILDIPMVKIQVPRHRHRPRIPYTDGPVVRQSFKERLEEYEDSRRDAERLMNEIEELRERVIRHNKKVESGRLVK